MKQTDKTKITAQDVRKALQSQYAAPEWYLGFEVGNSTGSNCRRHADAVAINAYPSKGFEIRGFEIKVSKSDLKSELDNGLKSDEIARFCDYWFLVVPKGMADEFTLPPTWGVIEYFNGALRQKKRAEKLDKQQPPIGFMCAMLRGCQRTLNAEIEKRANEIADQRKANISYMARRDSEELQKLTEKIKEIKEKTGIELSTWTPTQSIIDKLNAAQNINIVARNMGTIKYAADELLKSTENISKAIHEMSVINEN